MCAATENKCEANRQETTCLVKHDGPEHRSNVRSVLLRDGEADAVEEADVVKDDTADGGHVRRKEDA